MTPATESRRWTTHQRLFVGVLILLSLIPLQTSLTVLIGGSQGGLEGQATTALLDNRYRYLGGLYLGLTLLIWSIAPRIEHHRRTLIYVAVAIALGGIGRAISILDIGSSGTLSYVFLVVELTVPLIVVWHSRIFAAGRGGRGDATNVSTPDQAHLREP